MEELKALGILGENVEKEYGERLVKNIKAYVNQENLQHYLDARNAKRPKLNGSTPKKNCDEKSTPQIVDIEDEFATEIDFNAIEIPPPKADASNPGSNKKTSTYFGGS